MRFKSPDEVYDSAELAATRLAAKNNNGLAFLSDLWLSIYPDATFFALVRDPVALWESHKRRRLWRDTEAFSDYFNRMAARIEADAERLPAYHVARFEDVVRRPLDNIRRLHAAAGLEPDEAPVYRFRIKGHYSADGTYRTPSGPTSTAGIAPRSSTATSSTASTICSRRVSTHRSATASRTRPATPGPGSPGWRSPRGRDELEMTESQPKARISVVTPTLDRPAEVAELLTSLGRQTLLPTELVLVDGAAEDDRRTEDIVERHRTVLPFACTYHRHGGGTAIQRNVGIDASTGDLVAFVDDDVRLEPDFFAVLARLFAADRRNEIGAIVGYRENKYFSPDSTARWRWYRRLRLLRCFEPGRYDFECGYPVNALMQPPSTVCERSTS